MSTSDQPKKMTLSLSDKKILGVCGGIAEYFEMDATVIRLLAIVLIFMSGVLPGVIAYFIAAAVMPKPTEQQ